MSVFFDIEVALQTKLNSIVGHPLIVWEAQDDYDPNIGTRFWWPRNIPFDSVMETADRVMKHSGVYQVSVHVPTNKGLKVLMQDLDTIYEAFNTNTSLTSGVAKVEINAPTRGRVTIGKVWTSSYIEINYYCRTK